MKKILLFLAVCSLSPSIIPAQSISGEALFGSLRARQIGPAVMSGRTSTLAIVEDQPEVMYVGSAGGGVWKTVNAGASFRPVFDEHTQSIGKITIDPNDHKTVWVGTGEVWVRNSVSVGDGIYKSTDGGTTWQHQGLEDSERISDIIVHPDNSDVVYAGAMGHLWDSSEQRGVYKTVDGGTTWENILYIDENTGCADLDIDPVNPDIMYAAMWSYRRYPWSFDSGLNGNSALYKSTDGGNTWAKIHNGFPDETLGRIGIAVAPSNGNTIYASVECKSKEGKGLYLSTDQGNSWSRVNNEFNTTVRPFYFSNLIVDPLNDSIVMKCGLTAIISENRGEVFRQVASGVHSDIHDIWIDRNNTKHVILATDGGVYESFDRGYTFKMFMNLPVSQFYRISVDNAKPYNIYGGLQDNGSWFGPSRKSGGITNSDWQRTFGGDGFYSFAHQTDPDIVYSEYQGGNLVRYNRKTGVAKYIKPYPSGDDEKYRFNWNSPIQLSPSHPDRIYFASQYVFRSEDRGESWTQISGDLTTNDPDKLKQHLSGGLSIDNSTAENHCTIYAIEESAVDDNVVWVGSDDGLLHVTRDGGETWSNVTRNVPGVPSNTWISDVEPSPGNAAEAYVTFDGHRTGDHTVYLYRTTDYGRTWQSLGTEDIEGYALSVRQDLENENLLFLGTEFGLFISVDGGAGWAHFTNNMPRVGVRDMVIHPRENALVMGTHGRGVVILDDITPLRQISDEVLAEKVHFFEIKPTVLSDPGAGGGWFGGAGGFVAPNPNTNAKIVYYLNRRHTFGKMYFEVYKDGKLIREIPAGKSAGINMVEMPTALDKPKAAPTNNRMALFGSLSGPNLEAGKYEVRMIKGKDVYKTEFELVNDPEAPYSDEERALQHKTLMQLYDLTEQLAYIYASLDQVETKANERKEDIGDLKSQLEKLAEKALEKKTDIVALEGDFYVDESENIREKISTMYLEISSYPGKPSESQIKRTNYLAQELAEVQSQFDTFIQGELARVNDQLTARDAEPIRILSFEEFKSGSKSGS